MDKHQTTDVDISMHKLQILDQLDVDMADVEPLDMDILQNANSNISNPDPSAFPQPQEEKIVSQYYPMNEQLCFTYTTIANWSFKIPEGECYFFNPKANLPHTLKSGTIAHIRPNGRSNWQLIFSSDYFHQKQTRTVLIYLWRLPSYNWWSVNNDPLPCMYKVQILDSSGNPVFTKESGLRYIGKDDCYGWKDFAPFNKVQPYIVNGVIKLRVEISSFHYNRFNRRMDLADIYKEVKIKIGNGRPIKVRKDAVMKRSKTLHAYFCNTDNKLDEITMPNSSCFSTKVIHNAIDYMSRGRCPMIQVRDYVNLPELWDCANRLQIEDLKVDIFDTLVSSDCLKVQNVTPVVIFVHKNKNDIKIKAQYGKSYNKLKRFVIRNMQGISESASFKKILVLHKDVAEEFANLVMEDNLFEPFPV